MWKMTDCDNATSKGHQFIGAVAYFNYHGNNFTFSNMYSSTVKSIERIDNTLIVKTRNTTYTFALHTIV